MRTLALPLAFVAMAHFATGCGTSYATAYRPPADGRARVVWGPGGEAAVDTGGLPLTVECAAAIRQLTGRASAPFMDGTRELPKMPYAYPTQLASGYVPAYYGAQVVAPSPVLAPRFVANTVFFATMTGPSRGSNPGYAPRPPGVSGGGGGVITGSGGGHGTGGGRGTGGSSGSSGGGGNGAVIAAVLIALTLPLLDVGIAASTPESGTRMSSAADVVNAWNDSARTPGSPCALGYGLAVTPAPVTPGVLQ